jgi:cell division protein FtsW
MGGTASVKEREIAGSGHSQVRTEADRMRNLLFSSAAALIIFGWVMLIDTGMIFEGHKDTVLYGSLLFKRGACMILGVIALLLSQHLNSKALRQAAPWVMTISLLLLALVFTPLGVTIRGCRGWLDLGPLGTFQPLEFAKLALVWFLAATLTAIGPLKRAPLSEYLGPAVLVGITILLVICENEFSGMMFLAMLVLLMAILSGLNRAQFMWISGSSVLAAVAVIAFRPEKFNRFLPLIDPYKYSDGIGYQVCQSLWAVFNGGLWGLGPGRSIAMYSLPDHTTDFIFSIITEEYGLIGGFSVLILLAVFAWAAFKVALAQKDPFRLYLGCGIALIISLQAVINIGVTTNILPVTGLPLPFISAGNSSLIMAMFELGLLLNLVRSMDHQAAADRVVSGSRLRIKQNNETFNAERTSSKNNRSIPSVRANRKPTGSESEWLHPSDVDVLIKRQLKRAAR